MVHEYVTPTLEEIRVVSEGVIASSLGEEVSIENIRTIEEAW